MVLKRVQGLSILIYEEERKCNTNLNSLEDFSSNYPWYKGDDS